MAIPPHPELTWSRSHSKMLRACKRQWFYDKMLSWQGWDSNAPERRRGAYMLKQVTTLAAMRGTIVHDLIDDAILKIHADEVDLDELVAEGMTRFEIAWDQSVEGRWQKSPKHHTNFYSHLYGLEIDKGDALSATKSLLERSFSSLLNEFAFGQKLREVWREYHTFSFANYASIPVFWIDGAKIHALPDFVGVRHDGTVDLLDWKTGREHAVDQVQIAFYYMTARQGALDARVTIDASTPVTGRLVYLSEGAREVPVSEDAEDLEMLREQIVGDVSEIRGLASELSLGGKTLLEVKDEDECNFPLTSEKDECSRCSYLFLCREELGLGDRESTKAWLKRERAAAAGEWVIDEEDDEG